MPLCKILYKMVQTPKLHMFLCTRAVFFFWKLCCQLIIIYANVLFKNSYRKMRPDIIHKTCQKLLKNWVVMKVEFIGKDGLRFINHIKNFWDYTINIRFAQWYSETPLVDEMGMKTKNKSTAQFNISIKKWKYKKN